MMDRPGQPAIVKAASTELDQLAFEATSALEAGDKAARTTLERYKDAGEALAKAKIKVKHGEWLKWLEKNKITQSTANRAMRIATNWSKSVSLTDLTDALRQLTDPVPEDKVESPQAVTSTAPPVTPPSPAPEKPAVASTAIKIKQPIRCSKCLRLDLMIDCPLCDAMRREGAKPEEVAAEPAAPTQPGFFEPAKAKPEAPKPRNPHRPYSVPGEEAFSWIGFEDHMLYVLRTPGYVIEKHPAELHSAEYDEMVRLTNETQALAKAWKARLTK